MAVDRTGNRLSKTATKWGTYFDTNMYLDTCPDTYPDTYLDMCPDTCLGTCPDTYLDTCQTCI